MEADKPIIAIVGSTASGKSTLAMKLARKYGGEIICADSRTIYKQMDVGTAKPTPEDQEKVEHHCLDLINPDKNFSAADFKRCALEAIDDIRSRNKIPLVIGGSGLYVDGLMYDFDFSDKSDPARRSRLEATEIKKLQAEATKIGISPEEINFNNKRHLARAVERGGVFNNRKPLKKNRLILGIEVAKQELDRKIEDRIELMFSQGIESEARSLIKKYGPDAPGLLAPGYRALAEYINGTISFEAAKTRFIQNDKQLAKRQKTWFKRNKDTKWIKSYPEAEKQVADFLEKFGTISR
ncbi:tRNA (adenosine(37)-N6)-dimethylallyltransferase MiaA [Candidatus Parcubacteria bacterium]|nr:tRNA (adenosine(37)-N6)-dimethylallyltransferase MiaA [Candidatus Parcubacteria bacterium]